MSVLLGETAVRSDDDAGAFPARLLLALALLVFLQVLFAGSRIADWDLTSAFVAMSQGRDPGLEPGRQFLLKGLLPNAVGMGYASLGLSCPRLSWTPLCPRSPPW